MSKKYSIGVDYGTQSGRALQHRVKCIDVSKTMTPAIIKEAEIRSD